MFFDKSFLRISQTDGLLNLDILLSLPTLPHSSLFPPHFFLLLKGLWLSQHCVDRKSKPKAHIYFFIPFPSLFFYCLNPRINFLFNDSYHHSLNSGKLKLCKSLQDGDVQLLGDWGNLKHPRVFKYFIFHMKL